MRDLLTAFQAHSKLAGHSPATIERRRISVGLAIRSAQASSIEGITRDGLEIWLISYESPQTRRSYLADLRAFFKWAIERGHVELDPTIGIPVPKVPARSPTPLDFHQCELVRLACLDQQDRVVIELGLRAGLRVSEMAALTLDNIDFHGNTLTVRNGKGGKDRSVPMADALATVIRAGGPTVVNARTGNGVSSRIKRVLRRAGVPGRSHDLRHTFATELTRQTGNIQLVAQLLGHASIQTTLRYSKLDPPGASVMNEMYSRAA